MPAEAALESAEQRGRHGAEIQFFHVAILKVIRDAVGKDVIDVNIANAETVALEEFAAFATGIGVGDGAAGLRFGIFGHQFGQFPKPSAAFREQNAEHFPGAAMIDHDFHGRAGVRVGAELFEHTVRVRRVVNHAEGINQIVGRDGHEAAQLFGVAAIKLHLDLNAVNGGSLTGERDGFFREIDTGDLRAVTREIYGVGADAAADFENRFAAPALEIGEGGNVRLDAILAGFDFVKIFLGADRLRRVTDVTGTRVPVILDASDGDFFKSHGEREGRSADWFRLNASGVETPGALMVFGTVEAVP